MKKIITQTMAASLLATVKRGVRSTLQRDLYKEAMNNGRWVYNGESIKISKTGELVDGVMRLSALILCKQGTTIKSEIVKNVDPDLRYIIDQQGKYPLWCELKKRGIKYYEKIGPTIRMVAKLSNSYKNANMSVYDILDILMVKSDRDMYYDAISISNKSIRVWKDLGLTPSFVSACAYLELKTGRPKSLVQSFINDLASGKGAPLSINTYKLLKKNMIAKSRLMSTDEKRYIVIYALNGLASKKRPKSCPPFSGKIPGIK